MIYNDVKYGSVDSSNLAINENELAARLGYNPDISTLKKEIDRFNGVTNYRYAYVKVPIEITNEAIDFGFSNVSSVSLSKVLDGCKEAYILAVSTGIDTDRLINKLYLQSSSEAFITDCIGSVMVESLADFVNFEICKDLNTTQRFSPGYADFPLDFQKPLLDRLNAPSTVGISLSEQLFMTPMKSITAIIGVK